ncbi:DNA (cytosine-5)-methyltransferase 3-like [Ochotona princeps]|uniref:DNA (cytosine-5)-methyltransferase 3-like n=1 Tax=Ochotona princeps TaxID=9978 RepID=UPI002714CA59|nr:DNA (cytosine-5)-methyltransferase 3-like [Ochotona princeps]
MALPSPETLDSLDRVPASHPDEQHWTVCDNSDPILEVEAEGSMDVILVDNSPAPSGRDRIELEVKVNQRSIEDFCLCCGSSQVHRQHPLFQGGLCAPCKDKFLEALFLYDEDGYQSYCSICGLGDTLLVCESPDCTRGYCFACVDGLVGAGSSGHMHTVSPWVCFLCVPGSRHGLLQRRRRWRTQLKVFHEQEAAQPLEIYETVPACRRKPLRVLSLFEHIEKELASLGFLETGSSPGQIRHLDDVTDVVRRDVEQWGPFDLVYGSTPPLGHSSPRSPGWYLFQFHRMLQYTQPTASTQRPFFWMFVDNLLLTRDDLVTATRFLEVEPATLQDVRGRVLQGAMRVWSNIPAVNSRHTELAPEAETALLAQSCRRAKASGEGLARLLKSCFLPLREYFKYFPQSPLPLRK